MWNGIIRFHSVLDVEPLMCIVNSFSISRMRVAPSTFQYFDKKMQSASTRPMWNEIGLCIYMAEWVWKMQQAADHINCIRIGINIYNYRSSGSFSFEIVEWKCCFVIWNNKKNDTKSKKKEMTRNDEIVVGWCVRCARVCAAICHKFTFPV